VNLPVLLSIIAVFFTLLLLDGCKPQPPRTLPVTTPTPAPTPTPTPVPYVPAKHMETAKLFNGIQIHATVETENGATAKVERNELSSYTLNLQLKVRVPKPHADLQELRKLNDHLPALLPWLEASLSQAKISRFYDDFYRLKINALNHDLPRLDQLISRQHFFDCETALEFQNTASKRRALLIQASMEVDTDGSDSDRAPIIDGSSPTFQPMTSYKWTKRTDRPNSFLSSSEDKLRKYEQELASKPANPVRARDLRELLIPEARYEVGQLKKNSFLVAADDPYISLPAFLLSQEYEPYAPKVGDYCVIIFNNTLYPAIVGDAGPNYKIGEASLRICKEINPLSNANNRPVSDLKVTYLVFPNSADKPFSVPDLDKWHARCDQFLVEMGGYHGDLKAWVDLTKPKPTPTSSPSPSTSPAASPSPAVSVSPAPPISPVPAASPASSPSASPSSTRQPIGTPSASASPASRAP